MPDCGWARRLLQDALQQAAKLGGRTGTAARALVVVLHPHFEREEQIALPPLSMLAPLARGEPVATPGWLLPITDSLRRELPRMLREHVAIRAATQRLAEAARAEGQTSAVQLTETLALHARSEEEILYPAAILVGDLVPRDPGDGSSRSAGEVGYGRFAPTPN